MMEQISAQLFKQFAACVRATLEAEAAREAPSPGAAAAPIGQARTGGASPGDAPAPAAPHPAAVTHRAEPIRGLPLFFRALWATVGALLRRLLGRGR
jgi:hypothetical protein